MASRVVQLKALSSLVYIVLAVIIDEVICRLQPAENLFPTDVNKALLPNDRPGLNDCHLRYHKYGDYNLIYPIFGVPARIGEFAHMAAIGWTDQSGFVDFNCGGSLITARHVLTGAHCASRDGVAPDTVRLGVINVNESVSDQENRFGQQFRIASFKRHPEHKFSSYYNDIGLITLNGIANINDAVIPACLWNQAEVEFPKLEAAGFGQTSYAGDKTPILLKVQLNTVTNEECKTYHSNGIRKLRQGIVSSQLCAKDKIMDTCLGDSGGPLQIKLMSNHRMTPFIVGITSFGIFCGTETPSVYTRVSSYLQWIEEETGESFEPGVCTARYVKMREADESMISNRVGDHVFIEPEKSYMDIEIMPKHRVYLGYSNDNTKWIQWNCGATLINEDYVLTVAHCDKFIFNQTPSHAKIGDLDINKNHPAAQIIAITNFIKHPNYREGFLDNDIALVKLAKDVQISQNVIPACLVDNDLTLPFYEMAGLGPFNQNNFIRDEEIPSTNRELTLTRMRVDPTTCGRSNSKDVICARNNKFLVPQTCRIEHGGSLEREIWHYDRYFQYVFGITVAGKDCGFGSDAYFLRTSTHIKWIESIVLNKTYETRLKRRLRRQIVFPGDNYHTMSIGQSCITLQNTQGVCQYYRTCMNVSNMVVKFCKHGIDPVVCCNKSSFEMYELKKCVTYWKKYKQPEEDEYESIPSEGRPAAIGEYPHVAFIGILQGSTIKWNCVGVLISPKFVLTSLKCAENQNIVRLGTTKPNNNYPTYDAQDIFVEKIVFNSGFNTNPSLALLKLVSEVKFNNKVLPACLWPNQSAIPLKGYTLGLEKDQLITRPRVLKYNQDCRKYYHLPNLLDGEQICAENYYTTTNSCQDKNGDPIEGIIPSGDIRISVIVGITDYTVNCNTEVDTATVYTRISGQINWIRSIVEA